jgi:DNA-binding GntR family transcriptional regulator
MTIVHHPDAAVTGQEPEEPLGYRLFRDAMDRGTLEPGMTLTQNDLCSILGLSLTPLRETLVLLQSYGLVKVKARTGIHIVYPDVAFIRENFQFRIMIELGALAVFAQSDISGWLAEMTEAHDRSARDLAGTGNIEEAILAFIATDRKFHADIVGVLNNRAISATHRRLQENIGLARKAHKRTVFRQQLLDTVEEHRRVLAALSEGDIARATEALEAHFRDSTHRTFAA